MGYFEIICEYLCVQVQEDAYENLILTNQNGNFPIPDHKYCGIDFRLQTLLVQNVVCIISEGLTLSVCYFKSHIQFWTYKLAKES